MGLFSKLFARQSPSPSREPADSLPEPSEDAPLARHDDALSRLAGDPHSRQEFLSRVVTDGVWILATVTGAVTSATSRDEILNHIEDQARRLSQREVGDIYLYSLKGSKVLPVFSTAEAAQEFLKRLKFSSVTGFHLLCMNAEFWPHNDFGLTRVIFNPFSNCATEFSESEIGMIQAMASEQNLADKTSDD
jgi:hypothetical protein